MFSKDWSKKRGLWLYFKWESSRFGKSIGGGGGEDRV
jgi:hypothetical protein